MIELGSGDNNNSTYYQIEPNTNDYNDQFAVFKAGY